MKRLILISLLLTLPFFAVPGEFSASVSGDWKLALYGGVEYRGEGCIGVRADLGIAVMGSLTMDLLCCFYTLPRELPGEFNILMGITDFGVPLSFTACMIATGASIQGRYWFDEKTAIDLRLGAGFPFFFEKDKEIIRDINLPLDLWPDLMIGVTFRIKKEGPGEPGP